MLALVDSLMVFHEGTASRVSAEVRPPIVCDSLYLVWIIYPDFLKKHSIYTHTHTHPPICIGNTYMYIYIVYNYKVYIQIL